MPRCRHNLRLTDRELATAANLFDVICARGGYRNWLELLALLPRSERTLLEIVLGYHYVNYAYLNAILFYARLGPTRNRYLLRPTHERLYLQLHLWLARIVARVRFAPRAPRRPPGQYWCGGQRPESLVYL